MVVGLLRMARWRCDADVQVDCISLLSPLLSQHPLPLCSYPLHSHLTRPSTHCRPLWTSTPHVVAVVFVLCHCRLTECNHEQPAAHNSGE